MKKIWWVVTTVVFVLAVGGGVVWKLGRDSGQVNLPTADSSQSEKDSLAVKAGKQISNGDCTGKGSRELTRLPMDESDYAMILPYGLMVQGHVTPIDHQYFSPTVFHSPVNTYPVYAMADSKVVDIQQRLKPVDPKDPANTTDYRFVFSVSCTFLYYYDLVTGLAPEMQAAFDKHRFGVDVKAGQLIGRIGAQTLDFAVWDTTKPLQNFINPAHYQAEAWKIYTADPLDYYSADAKAKALAKYDRTTAPLSGRIDYDIDGKLRGNWFEVGTGGYHADNNKKQNYWAGHLVIAPEALDNSALIVSVGSWNGDDAAQYAVKDPVDPTTVGVDSGLVKYELYGYEQQKSDGTRWDSMTLAHNVKVALNPNGFAGCILFQLTDTRLLKSEQFASKKCADVSAFTAAAKIYER